MSNAGGSVDASLPPATAAKPNPFARIAGIFFSPVETLRSIEERPDVLVPLLVLIVVSFIILAVTLPHIDFTTAMREALEKQHMPPERMERSMRYAESFSRAIFLAIPVVGVGIMALFAGAVLIVFRMFGYEGTFKQAFSAWTYISFIGVVESFIRAIVMMSRPRVSAEMMAVAVRSNLGFLVDFKTQRVAFALLSSIDIFTIWTVVLLIIAFAFIGRTTRGRSAAIIIPLWAVLILCKVGMAALQSAFGPAAS